MKIKTEPIESPGMVIARVRLTLRPATLTPLSPEEEKVLMEIWDRYEDDFEDRSNEMPVWEFNEIAFGSF